MRDHQVPGLVLAITEGDSITILKGYGSSNLEHLTPMSASTVFESASLGKTFTAAAILLLVQEGKLRLDDPIKNYLNNNFLKVGKR
jgi:CubicO group peptidase (beta-lactamase class C family)